MVRESKEQRQAAIKYVPPPRHKQFIAWRPLALLVATLFSSTLLCPRTSTYIYHVVKLAISLYTFVKPQCVSSPFPVPRTRTFHPL